MGNTPRNTMTGTRITESDAKALKALTFTTGKTDSEIIYECLKARLDGLDQFESVRAELIEHVIAATEQSTALMIEAVTAAVTASVSVAVLGKLDQSIKAALADMGKPEREARARLQLNTEKLFNTIQADIQNIDLKFKAISDTLVAMQGRKA